MTVNEAIKYLEDLRDNGHGDVEIRTYNDCGGQMLVSGLYFREDEEYGCWVECADSDWADFK